ncbi:MAG: hypothetical protein IKP65_06660 [Alphaproteobacteria bacterium]|nr:hypothetical protein [Alphaproteobacteria bacterium]
MKQVIGFKCDYCKKIFSNKEKCLNHEKHHKRTKEIINTPVIAKLEKEEGFDTSCWYINAFEPYYKVMNEKGEKIDLNTKQGHSDYKFWKDLHLKQKTSDFTFLCDEYIVYAHNVSNGYIKTIASNIEEAINMVRSNYIIWRTKSAKIGY